jgi:hypothetical protein
MSDSWPPAHPPTPPFLPPHFLPPHFLPTAPPKAKRSVWKWVLVAVIALVVLVGGCSLFVFRSLKEPVDVTNDFMNAVQNDDWPKAMSLVDTSSWCFGETAQADIETFFGGQTIQDYSFLSSFVEAGGGPTMAEVTGAVTTADTGEVAVSVVLIETEAEWLVCGLSSE